MSSSNARSPSLKAGAVAVVSLEIAWVREAVFFTLLIAAFISPDIVVMQGGPAIRLEQILLLLLLPSVVTYHLGHPEARRLDLIDVLFVLLAVTVTLSIVLAPLLVPAVGRSYRDLFQLLRLGEYWLLYRVARIASTAPAIGVRATHTFALMAIAGGLFAFAQVVGGDGFNDAVTAIWTGVTHNLAGVVENNRAVGTAGNANNFGLLEGWLALVAWVALTGRSPRPSGQQAVLSIALAVASGAMVLSQSRSATLSILGAAAVGTVFLAARRGRPSLSRPIALAVSGAAVAGAMLFGVQHGGAGIGQRFNLPALANDPSVVERLTIIRYVFGERDESAMHRLICDGPPAGTLRAGHEPALGGQGSISPTDAAAKKAAAIVAAALEARYCTTGTWPDRSGADQGPLGSTQLTVGPGGYSISSTLSDQTDPDWPAYVLTSQPNLVLDPSFESLADGNWHATTGAAMDPVTPGAFGKEAGRAYLPPGTAIEQWVVYGPGHSEPFVGSIWVRTADRQDHRVSLQFDAWLTSGDRVRAIGRAAAVVPADGRWVRLTTAFQTPPTGQVWVLHLAVSASSPTPVSIDLDGAELIAGSDVASFAYLRDANPATLPATLPSYWESPIVGLGPLSNVDFGAIDDEYVLVLVRFGLLGLAALSLLLVGLLGSAFLGWSRRQSAVERDLAFALTLALLATMVYDVAVGTFYQFQLMAILWLWAGLAVAAPSVRFSSRHTVSSAASSQRAGS